MCPEYVLPMPQEGQPGTSPPDPLLAYSLAASSARSWREARFRLRAKRYGATAPKPWRRRALRWPTGPLIRHRGFAGSRRMWQLHRHIDIAGRVPRGPKRSNGGRGRMRRRTKSSREAKPRVNVQQLWRARFRDARMVPREGVLHQYLVRVLLSRFSSVCRV